MLVRWEHAYGRLQVSLFVSFQARRGVVADVNCSRRGAGARRRLAGTRGAAHELGRLGRLRVSVVRALWRQRRAARSERVTLGYPKER